MKILIALLIIFAAYTIASRLLSTYKTIETQQTSNEPGTPTTPHPAAPAVLPGLPASLESSLSAAQEKGAAGLRDWLNAYRPYAHDPRLAAIELDYVVLISHQDSAEAKRIFKSVQDRISTSSPVYDRVKRLEKTFQ